MGGITGYIRKYGKTQAQYWAIFHAILSPKQPRPEIGRINFYLVLILLSPNQVPSGISKLKKNMPKKIHMFTSNMMKMILKNRCKKRHLGGVEWFELNAAETEINYRRNYQESNLHPTSSTQAYKHFINPTTSISSSNFHNYFCNLSFFIPIVQECCQPNLANISASILSTQSYKFFINPI